MSAKDNPTLTIRSECIDSEGRFRTDFTGRGKDISPELGLDGLAPDTRTLAVTFQDLTHPLFGSMAHGVTWNIPPGPAWWVSNKLSRGTSCNRPRSREPASEQTHPPPLGWIPHVPQE